MLKTVRLATTLSIAFISSTAGVAYSQQISGVQNPKNSVPVCYMQIPGKRIVNLSELCGKAPTNPVNNPNGLNPPGKANTPSNDTSPSKGNSSSESGDKPCEDKTLCPSTFGEDNPRPPSYSPGSTEPLG